MRRGSVRRLAIVIVSFALPAMAAAGARDVPLDPASERPPAPAPPAAAASRPVEPMIGGAYTEQGPGPLRSGQTEGIANNPVVGAVEALAVHPTDSNTVWVGSVNGGIWKTTNLLSATPTWTNQTATFGSLSISVIEVDPTDASGNTLYAAYDTRSAYGFVGGALNGVLKTTDGGTNWTAVGNLSNRSVTGLAPRGTIVVASVREPSALCTDLGIFRSTDSGASFTQVSNTASLPCGRTFDLAGDPLNNAHLITVVTQAPTAANRGVWRSTDTGANWTKLTTPFDATFQSTNAGRVEVAVGRRGTVGNGGAAGANVFFAFCPSSTGALSGLYGSTDAGASWTAHTLPSTPDPAAAPMGLHPGGQCSIHLSIVADPTVHSAVYLGGDRQPYATEGNGGATYFPNSSGANNYTARLFRSDFAAATTYPVTHCSSAANPGCGGAVRTASNSAPHADSREMAFLPNGHLVETDDAGVYRNAAPNSPTGDWVSSNGNLAVGEQHDVAWDTVSNIAFAGNQDTGSGQQSATDSATWDTIHQGDGGDMAVAKDDPVAGQSTRYSSSQFLGGFLRLVYNSSNVLQSWAYPALTATGGSPAISPNFTTAVVVNAVTPTRLLFGAANGTYESSDRGNTITRISSTAVNDGLGGNKLVYGVTGNADALYVAAGANVLVRLVPPGTAPTVTSPGGTTVNAVAVKPTDAQRGFAVTQTAVFTTTNAGTNWTNVTQNLGTLGGGRFWSATYVPGPTDDLVVVGTDRGVYTARVSQLGTATPWTSLGTGLPNALVFDLTYDLGDDLLIAGTMGRGAFKLTGLQSVTPVELLWVEAE